jgi:hypothetical protein
MMPASPAELFRFQTLRILLFVLRHGIVAFFAIGALHRNDIPHMFLTWPSMAARKPSMGAQ